MTIACQNPPCPNEAVGKFCSKSCAATVNNRRHPKRKRAERTCRGCPTILGPRQEVYCSTGCSTEHQARQRVEAWLAGEWSGCNGTRLSATVRSYLLAQAGHRCPRCGWGEPNPVTGQVILTIDHIDGDATNNAPENLQVLCFNCHTLTPTFGVLNSGNGKRLTLGQLERASQRVA